MVSRSFLCATLISLLTFYLPPCRSKSDDDGSKATPTFAFSWLDNRDEFRAGDVATVKVIVLGTFKAEKYKYHFRPNITVNEKMGNSSYITGVRSDFGPDMNNWKLSFMPIMVGLFNVLITDDHFKVFDSSMHFRVTPGQMYAPGGTVSWMNQVNSFVAGTKAAVLILPKDAFGNNVTSASEGTSSYNLTVSATYENGSIANILNVTNKGWNGFGYLYIEFLAVAAGSLLLHVHEKNQTLIGSPLPFTVVPGALEVGNCVPWWITETKSFQLFSTMETFVNQQDRYGNLVPGLYSFDFVVMEKGTNLSLPIGDLQFKEVSFGVQSFSFRLVEPGDFILMISDKDKNHQILNMPYEFTVFIGYCDGFTSIVNGSGLNNSVAGEVSTFSVFLKDAYQYPSPLELERLRIDITLVTGLLRVYPNISAGNGTRRSSVFEVSYVPEKAGVYEIRIFCGNIPLNGGYPFRKEVIAGKVNVSMSGVVNFAPKVPKSVKNEIVVQLVDSFSNPVLSQESKLKLEMASINRSGFSIFLFVDNKNGTYTGSYLAMDVGTYEICASFDGRRFLPCPFGVNVYSSEYFPVAYNDTVSVWEDESTAFSVLVNDYFAGGNATIVEYQNPGHGSLLQFGDLFRYTPYKGFYGNDSFTYKISDVNGNVASGAVNIYVLCIPPQFVSFPSQLQATEDILSPKFGSYSGFEITYSDSVENISVTLTAQHGNVFLSPFLMQLWETMWNELSVTRVEGSAEDLRLVGRLEVINFALQSLQYMGHENFSGTDAIRVTTMNGNGKNDLDVPIFVEPINDPPVINVPEFIILEKQKDKEGSLIFDRPRDKFNYSIIDPDLLHFPGNETHFRVMFSAQVNSGSLSADLPAELISTTELKLKNSNRWQPLQTFVSISRHFTVKAKAIRFHGTINECNSVLQRLSYYGDEHGGVLTLTVNDMGWYGCYPDCAEMMSVPLFSEASVNLITRTPIDSLVAHTLGSVIVIEFIVLSSLGVLLLFFMWKCTIVLMREKKNSVK